MALILGLGGIAFVACRYLHRPPFAGGFYIIGHGYVADWERDRSVSLPDGRVVFIDTRANILLVVQVQNSETTWIPAGLRNGYLSLHRMRDNAEVSIEWRRDCLTQIDGLGNPRYTSMSALAFKSATNSATNFQENITKLINKLSGEESCSIDCVR